MKRRVFSTLMIIAITFILATNYVSATEALVVKQNGVNKEITYNSIQPRGVKEGNQIIAENEYDAMPISLENEEDPAVDATSSASSEVVAIKEDNVTSNGTATSKEDNVNKVGNEIVSEKTAIDPISGRVIILDDKYDASESTKKYADSVVNGNVFLVNGESVSYIDSEINGNVFIAAPEVSFDNVTINGSLFICAKSLNVKDTKIQSVYAWCEEINMDKYTQIVYDARLGGETINIAGRIQRDLYAGGNVINVTDDAIIGRDANIDGKEISINSNSVNGKLTKQIIQKNENEDKNTQKEFVKYLIAKVIEIIIIALLALLVISTSPAKFVEDNRKLKFSNFIKSFFIGLVAILALVIAVTLLFVVGAPLYACAILFIGLALIMLGRFAFIISAGLRIANKSDKSSKGKDILTIVLVVLALDIIGILSFAGSFGTAIVSIVNTLVCLSGFGTIFEVLFAKKNKEKKIESKKEITKKEAVKKEENKVESNKKTEEIDDSKKADEKQEIANKADVESKNLDANKVETEEGTTTKDEEGNKE